MQTRTKKLLWAAIGVALGLGTIWVAANPMKIQTTWSSTKAVFTKLYLGDENELLEWTIEKDGKSLAITPDGVRKNPNSVSGGAFMLGWIGNSNLSNGLPGSGSIILAGIGNIVGKNASNTLSLASQNTKTLGGESSVIIAANGVTGSATFGLIAASEGALHNQGKDTIVLATHATEATTVPNGGLLIGNAQINANGAFVFNAKSGRLTATKDHSFIVNTHNGMIIGSNSGSIDGAKIPLTVNGAVKVGTEFNDKAGMVLKTSPDNKFSCLCFNGSDGATGVALNLGDACTQLCKTGSPNLKAVCGVAARTYEKNESASTFTNFCAVGSLQGTSPSMPLPWQTVSWSCQGVGGASNNVSCTATKKPCGSAEILVNGLCVPVYSCGGSLPAHAVAWSNSPQSNLTTQATWGYSATNTNLACKFGCAAGYTWNNNACVAQTYSCQGILPEGARPVNGDDTNLTSNLSWQAVASNTARKCEYTCAIGYTLHNGSCARLGYACTHPWEQDPIQNLWTRKIGCGDLMGVDNLPLSSCNTKGIITSTRKDPVLYPVPEVTIACERKAHCIPNPLVTPYQPHMQRDCKDKKDERSCLTTRASDGHSIYSCDRETIHIDGQTFEGCITNGSYPPYKFSDPSRPLKIYLGGNPAVGSYYKVEPVCSWNTDGILIISP